VADNPDALAARYPSMPGGAAVDASPRMVPRYPSDASAAHMAEAELPADEQAKWRARYPSMFSDTPAPAAPAAEGDQAAAPPAPQDDAAGESGEAPSLPEPYRDLTPPEGLEVDTAALATVAPDLQRLGVTREQATGLVGVLAKLEAQADAAVTAAQAAWRQEAAALPAATLADARSALKGAPPELLRVIEASRIGDHPAVIAFFAKLRSGSGAPVDDAELAARKRFPNTRWN
jgi:hypothetical protein